MPSDTFDPYREWLSIGAHERPVTHYRLLGLAMFESNPEVISAAADQRMQLVRTYQSGRRAIQSQQLLNELAAAKTCLLDSHTKATYDAVLQGQLASANSQAASGVSAGVPATVAVPPQAPTNQPPPLPMAQAQGTLNSAATFDHGPHLHGAPLTEDAPAPFYFQPWFPVMLVAGVMLLGITVWGLAVAMKASQRPVDEQPAPTPTVTTDGSTPPANEDPEPPDDGVVILQEAGGEVNLSAGTAIIDGAPRLVVHDGKNLIAGITSTDDRLRWQFRIEKPAAFRIEATYSTMPEAAGGEFVLATDNEKTKTLTTRDTGGADLFTSERIGFIWLKRSGRHQITLVPQTIPAGQSLMTLQSLRLVPVAGTSGQP